MKLLAFGELMLRLAPARDGERLDCTNALRVSPGGSEANTAVALKSLGPHEAAFLSAFPDSPLAENCLRTIRAFDVEVICLPSSGDRMGLYWLDIGKGPRSWEVYYDRAGSAFAMIDPTTIGQELLKCDWFHSSGISPAISERSCHALFRCVENLQPDTSFSFDLNFRNKLWRWTRKKEMRRIYAKLCSHATLLTGNETDFQICLGMQGVGETSEEIYSSIAKKAFSEFQELCFIAVSIRKSHSATSNSWSGIFFIRDGNSFKKITGKSAEIDSIVDRLGTGDSFTAGILHGLSMFDDCHEKTLDFALMLSALNHSTFGDFSPFTEKEVFEALKTQGSGIVQR